MFAIRVEMLKIIYINYQSIVGVYIQCTIIDVDIDIYSRIGVLYLSCSSELTHYID